MHLSQLQAAEIYNKPADAIQAENLLSVPALPNRGIQKLDDHLAVA